jgi:hypothetical protein
LTGIECGISNGYQTQSENNISFAIANEKTVVNSVTKPACKYFVIIFFNL